MKKLLQLAVILIMAPNFVFAEIPDGLDQGIKQIQKDWAIAKYQFETKDQKIEGYRKCVSKADSLIALYPNKAEGLIWKGICLSSEAELTKLTALGKVKKAKKIFEEAARINDKALDGSAYTNLAVLHQRVPGWPIGFGDEDIAEEYFKKALAIAPNNIDVNYFYALFLRDEKEYEAALKHLRIALDSPSRNRPLADLERKKEIKKEIVETKAKL